jgi:hypothetical protein
MRIAMKKFGQILVSRPAGREAFLAAQAYILPASSAEAIELDFEGVKVLAPSWADEFLTALKKNYKNPIQILPTKNSSVIESLKTLEM